MKIVHILSLAFFLLAATPVVAEVVNINKADAAALAENLNGIGVVKAKEIVKYRRGAEQYQGNWRKDR